MNNDVADVRAAIVRGLTADGVPDLLNALRRGDYKMVRRLGASLGQTNPNSLATLLPGAPRVLHVRITGTSTVDHLKPVLTGELARAGLASSIEVAPFGSYIEELFSPLDVSEDAVDYLILSLDIIHVLEGLEPGWTVDEFERELQGYLESLKGALASYRSNHDSRVIMNTPILPRQYYLQILSYEDRLRASIVWREFTASILGLASDIPAVWAIDSETTAAPRGSSFDPVLSRYTGVHQSDEFSSALMRETAHLIAAAEGRSLKVLVMDLDDTLWGGTLAEDGVEGLENAYSPRGESFKALQRCARHLARQGVLLVICSKNESEDVSFALDAYPGFDIGRDELTVVDASWDPKPERIAEIARRLNLSVDAFAFLDDNDTELGAASHSLPGLLPLKADPDCPPLSPSTLLDNSWFGVLASTTDDRSRTEKYRTEYARAEAADSAGSYQEYLASLHTAIAIHPSRAEELPRVAQLTLRTNQWNTTAIRLDGAMLARYIGQEGRYVFSIYCKDRFGDHGLIGAVFLSVDERGGSVVLENFVMSCRVMGRGVEHAIVSEVARFARAHSFAFIVGHFRPTQKNEKARDLFLDSSFVQIDPQVAEGYVNSLDGCRSAELFSIQVAQLPQHPLLKYVVVDESLEV